MYLFKYAILQLYWRNLYRSERGDNTEEAGCVAVGSLTTNLPRELRECRFRGRVMCALATCVFISLHADIHMIVPVLSLFFQDFELPSGDMLTQRSGDRGLL